MKRLFSSKYSDNVISLALFVLRLVLGGLMIPHGYQKLISYASQSSSFADPFGIGPAASMALTIFAEFFCAAFIILGLFTRLAAVPLVIAMSVALFYRHNGQFFGEGESAGLYLVCFLAILIMGPGKASVDRMIYK